MPDWPSMIIEEQSIRKDYFKKYSGVKLIFTHNRPQLHTGQGLLFYSRVILIDSNGKSIYKKDFEYSSNALNRQKSVEDYKDDNFKLFKEEVEFAADTIVSVFIDDIKRSLSK